MNERPGAEIPGTWRAETLTTWGRVCRARTQTLRAPIPVAALQEMLRGAGPDSVIAYGAGRCYGDASLNSRGRTLLTDALRRIVEIDRAARIVVAEAGVSFDRLASAVHPLGLTFPVAAATGAVTLGGAVANDVHGKNHHAQGSFGRHVVWFDLLLASGEIARVARDTDAELFRATIGGLGLTGLVLKVALRLIPIAAPAADARYRRVRNLDEFLDEMEPARLADPFWFGWVDALAEGASMGRGILETGRFAPDAGGTVAPPAAFAFRFDVPRVFVHPAVVRQYNRHRWSTVPSAGISLRKPLESFYFPLDHLRDFNRVYGRPGFYSIHCGLPAGERAGMHAVLAEIVRARAGAMTAVLKPIGGPGEGMVSFPIKGYAFAADLPRRPGVEELHRRLERIVLDHGGRLYLAKDALLSARGFSSMYPALEQFRSVLRRVDPEGRFQSDMSRRLGIRPELEKADSASGP